MKPEHISQYLYELRESATYTEVHEWGPHDADMLRRVTVLLDSAPEMLEALRLVEEAWTGNGSMARAVDAALLAIRKATEG